MHYFPLRELRNISHYEYIITISVKCCLTAYSTFVTLYNNIYNFGIQMNWNLYLIPFFLLCIHHYVFIWNKEKLKIAFFPFF